MIRSSRSRPQIIATEPTVEKLGEAILDEADSVASRRSLRIKRLVGCGVGGSGTATGLRLTPWPRKQPPPNVRPRAPRFALAMAKPAAAAELASPRSPK